MDSNLKLQNDLIKQFENLTIDWEEIRAKSISNGWHEKCSICMVSNVGPQIVGTSSTRKIKLLNCGHVFHESCLGSWVVFRELVQVCPLCRVNFFETDFYF